MLFAFRSRRGLFLATVTLFLLTVLLLGSGTRRGRGIVKGGLDKVGITKPSPAGPPRPKYKPTPTYTPPAVRDPFPALHAMATAPPIPKWNVAKKDLHKQYGLKMAPPLMIGFTRTWPLLLQAVVSYITAGWPPSQIYVVENTGVQQSNTHGRLSLQNPFFLNHTALRKLGVNVVQTPTLLSFAQLQNFYVSHAHAQNWPWYFWSHMDVVALSLEEGAPDLTPRYDQPGYKSLYELAVMHVNDTLSADDRWATRFFAYDHLTLMNRDALDDLGGWDTLIPYYLTDCDMYSRLGMAGWSQKDLRAGVITDVASVLDDLMALYRDPRVEVKFTDPNPPPPPPADKKGGKKEKRWFGRWRRTEVGAEVEKARLRRRDTQEDLRHREQRRGPDPIPGPGPEPAPRPQADPLPPSQPPPPPPPADPLELWRALLHASDAMFHHKHGDRGRNTWQQGQRGGFGEPYFYPAVGVAEAIDVLTEAGREVYRRKWGHRDCDLVSGAGLGLWDQWMVEKDWN